MVEPIVGNRTMTLVRWRQDQASGGLGQRRVIGRHARLNVVSCGG